MAETKVEKEEKKSLLKRFANAFNRENIAKAVFIAFAAFSILAVFAIIFYILYASIPALREVGVFNFIFGTTWAGSSGIYGIFPMIVTSLVLTLLSVLIGGTLAVFTAVFIVYYCPKPLKKVFNQLVNLLAGIPSIIYGYFGLTLLSPLLANMFGVVSGSGLLLSTIVLSIMILPTIASITKNSLESVPMHYYEGALALGCTKNQAVFRVMLPAARNGIIAAMILGIGRAVGETMAVQFLLGNKVNFPTSFFLPLTSLTSNIAQEMGYVSVGSTWESALFATGLVLLIFVLIINIILWVVKKNDAVSGNKFFTRKITEGASGHNMNYRKAGSIQDVLMVLSYIIAIIVAAALISIVLFVFIQGFPNISWNMLFGKSSNSNKTLMPSFITTGYIILISLVIALPLGVGAAIFLNEYAKRGSKFVKIVRLFIDTLAGVPSIVFGLFGKIFFCQILGIGVTILSGSLTMVLVILPTIIRSTEQSLSEVPDSMREASYALGAGKLRTVFKVVLPQALSGIITSIILAIGRIVGETAALIYTIGGSSYAPSSPLSRGTTFTTLIYTLFSEGRTDQYNQAYAAAAVLMIFVIILNLLVTFVEHTIKNKNSGKKGFISKLWNKLTKREAKVTSDEEN